MKRTIMIIGGGLLQVPVIQAAKKMDLRVIVTDYNPNAIGMSYADIPITMSTRDIEGSVRVAKTQHELTPISGVLTVGTDASMTVAAVANALNLPGIKFENAEAATNKIKMRTRFREHKVPSPDFRAVWSLSDAKKAFDELGFPLVIKPSDNMGARGVMRIDNKNMISDAFNYAKSASPSGELILEQFMEGPELSIDAVIVKNEVIFTGIADRIIEDLPYFVEKGHTMPSHLHIDLIEDAKKVMIQGIRALGLDFGFAKGDVKVTSEGAKIGELAARLSGGFMSAYTFPHSTGVDLMKAAVEIALGQEPGNLEPVFNKVCIERAIIPNPGIVSKISGIDEARKIPGINEIFLNVKPGDRTVKPRSNVEKAGNIIATADTLEEAEAIIAKAKEIINIEITEDHGITMDIIRAHARTKLNKVCFACEDCDGKKCPSGVPGMGGHGNGQAFRRNFEAIREYRINTRVIHNVEDPDISYSFLGQKISMPVMAAPITGTVTNMAGAIDEEDYARSIVDGCVESGTFAFVGDGATPSKYLIGIHAVKQALGAGIPIFKPRKDVSSILERIRAAEEAGCVAVGMDIDAIVFKTMAMKNQEVSPKNISELKNIISSTKLPFVLKGIMNPKDAELAVKAGAKAIVVSNHGGRLLNQMKSSIEALPGIVKAVKGSVTILVDGGFRNGIDVFIGLAAGADAVLIGRPMTIAAVGMFKNGVTHYLSTVMDELKKTMVLTGCQSLDKITAEHISHIKQMNG